jgi:hypothetical protein
MKNGKFAFKASVMKHLRTLITLLILMFVLSFNAQGVDERAANRAKNKGNQRVDTRIDQGLDKSMDAIEGIFKKKKKTTEAETPATETKEAAEEIQGEKENVAKSNEQQAAGSGMFGNMFKKAEWEDSYQFEFRSKAHVTTTDKKNKVEENDMEWMLSEGAFGMVVVDPKGKNPDSKIIFDFEHGSFITLTEDDGEKTGMAIAMDKDQIAASIEEGVEEGTVGNGSFKKTGKTKTILGYSCSEYTFKDEETEGSMWMTTEIDVEMNRVFGMMTQGSKNKSTLPENYPQGYAMEMNSRDTKRNETHHYLVTEIDTSADINIDLGPYNVMDPMSMMNSGK